jgi:hypothetical protein
MMIEQPLAWDDIVDHAPLQRQLETSVCLDESIHSAGDARRALDIGACRVVNIKVGRVGGFAEAIAVHDLCRAARVPVWCGGMLESGIGRLANVHLQTLPGFTLPGDTSASARYFEEDLIDPPVVVLPQGRSRFPKAPASATPSLASCREGHHLPGGLEGLRAYRRVASAAAWRKRFEHAAARRPRRSRRCRKQCRGRRRCGSRASPP